MGREIELKYQEKERIKMKEVENDMNIIKMEWKSKIKLLKTECEAKLKAKDQQIKFLKEELKL